MLTADLFLKEAVSRDYKVFYGTRYPLNLNIVGWRTRLGRPNRFDDILGVYWEENGKWQEKLYNITTRPGVPFLRNPLNPKGAAILVPGQYLGSHELGTFHGYQALKQVGPLRVYRDNNRDSGFDENPDTIESGLFGIHIHRAGLLTKLVGISSAGCQVFEKADDFTDFINICRHAADFWGTTFSYTLLEF